MPSIVGLLTTTPERLSTYLLKFEDVMVEVLLKLLVGEVDAKLFEAVHVEILKTKNVKHTNERRLPLGCACNSLDSEWKSMVNLCCCCNYVSRGTCLIYTLYKIVEETIIKGLGQRITRVCSL